MADSNFLFQLWTHRSDPVLHIELRRWADLLLVAPLDANTLGKIASGICDNLLVRRAPPFGPQIDYILLRRVDSPKMSCLY